MSASADALVRLAWPRKIDGQTHQPVLRNSHPADAATAWWRPTPKALAIKIMRGAERLFHVQSRTRRKLKRRREIYESDLTLLECLLFRFLDWKTGKLDCAYQQIREATGLCSELISQGLRRLAQLGVLERMRRFVRTHIEGKGPQVQQTTNAYRVSLPKRLAAFVTGAEMAPPPDDVAAEIRDIKLARDAHYTADTGKPTLGASLAKMGQGVLQRESKNQ
jgi:hypothetical protein